MAVLGTISTFLPLPSQYALGLLFNRCEDIGLFLGAVLALAAQVTDHNRNTGNGIKYTKIEEGIGLFRRTFLILATTVTFQII
jgi:hypothetical protein